MIAIPLMWKIGGIAVLFGALTVGGWWLHNNIYQSGYSEARAEYTAAELVATQAARVKEQELQGKVTEAIQNAKVRETKLKAAAIVLNNELSGLLFDLEEAARNLPGLTEIARSERAAALGIILGNCAKEYSTLAEITDRINSDRETLIQAWPK